jgi:hypothetical protein
MEMTETLQVYDMVRLVSGEECCVVAVRQRKK